MDIAIISDKKALRRSQLADQSSSQLVEKSTSQLADQPHTPSFYIGLVKTESDFFVRSVATGLER